MVIESTVDIESTIYAYSHEGKPLYVANPTARGETELVLKNQAQRARAIFTANAEVASVSVRNYKVCHDGYRVYIGTSYDIVAQGTI